MTGATGPGGSGNSVLEVRDLVTRFHTDAGVVNAVNGVSFSVPGGGAIGIVGESGSGKSASVLSVMGLIRGPSGVVESGRALLNGRDLLTLSPADARSVRGREVAMVFQDPSTSLNPVLTVGYQLAEAVRHHTDASRKDALAKAADMLALVGIPAAESRLSDYPHQFSGGQRQRIMIAMALVLSPKVLIADEPTTALDVTIQAQVVELVKELQERLGMAVVWITHDLALVAGLVDTVYVMYAGYVVERAPVRDLYRSPLHPYTRALLAAMPQQSGEEGGRETGGSVDGLLGGPGGGSAGGPERRLLSIEGQPPDLRQVFTWCPFAPRCPRVRNLCRSERPPMTERSDGRAVACWRVDEPDADDQGRAR